MKTYALTPQDLLFFRDARPTETSGGHGARWPEPSVIFDALHAALWRGFPEKAAWEHDHRFGRSSHRPKEAARRQRFGSLLTAGLFPIVDDGRWLFPAPADATPSTDDASWLLKPVDQSATSDQSNLPQPLCYSVASFAMPTKDSILPWWSAQAWHSYLQGKPPDAAELFAASDIFAGEWTTGIGIDPSTGTQDGQRIYSAEYLRLRPNVRCGFLASLCMKQNGDPHNIRECISELFTASRTIIVGGQQRVCKVEPLDDLPIPLPLGKTSGFQSPQGQHLVKYILLSPAIWPEIQENQAKGVPAHPGGWLPNWICPHSGKVLLKHREGTLRRVWDDAKGRAVRKADSESQINARLVAACVGKPIPITGWTERLHLKDHENWTGNEGKDPAHGPRPSHLAVPAGAVYYFEADTAEAAQNLAAALNWHGNDTPPTTIKNRRSTLLGEKGFGLGVCGTWQFFEPSVRSV
jgi:hypothetical protein